MNKEHNYHILTIEDPVEYLHSHNKSMVTQREIGEDASSFSSALRSALREDPDVIMVGEMRDKETMSIALSAAETGHLVLSTLHTVGAVKTIDRILDSFPSDQQNQVRSQLATVLEGIVSQQLLPAHNADRLVPACEVMLTTPAVRNLIREGKHYQINNIIQTGKDLGMCSLERNLAYLAAAGTIDEKTARIKAQNVKLFEQYLSIALHNKGGNGMKKTRILSSEDLSSLSRQLALVIDSDLTLQEGLTLIGEQIKSKALKALISRTIERLTSGQTLAEAFAEEKGILPRFLY